MDIAAIAEQLIQIHQLRTLSPGSEIVLSDFPDQAEVDAFYGPGRLSLEELRAVNASIAEAVAPTPVRIVEMTLDDCVEFLNAPGADDLSPDQKSGFANWRRCWVEPASESDRVI